MQLRSLHVDAGKTWRGGQRQVLLLADALRNRDHEPLVLGVPGAPLVSRAHDIGLATAAAPMRGDWDIRAARRVRALIRTWRPHIVHAHDARGHAIALLALAGVSVSVRPPLVVNRRVPFVPKSVRFKYGPRVARFIAISEAVKRAMVDGGIDPARIESVYSGVPVPQAIAPRNWRQELGWPSDMVIVGIVGAMTAEKGIQAVSRITEMLPTDAKQRTGIVFLGGESKQSPTLPGVLTHSAGFVADIYNAMAGLDLLWHPALHEGLGTSLIDAMALGIPPIAFAVGGIPEIVRDGKEGLLVPPEDVRAFAEAHRSLLDPAARTLLAKAGPPRATQFSVEIMTDRVEGVYEQVLSTRPRTRRPH